MSQVHRIAPTKTTRHHSPMPRSETPPALALKGASPSGFGREERLSYRVLLLGVAPWWVICVASVLGCSRPSSPVAPTAGTKEDEPKASQTSSEEAVEMEPMTDEESPHPLIDDREPDPSQALPELTYSHLGMHIGGEPNDPESKKPWLSAIEDGDQEILSCYRHVSDPMKGGSFGVDLHVGASGGHPEVRAVRQKIGDQVLEECMTKAFSALTFPAPQRPTVLSYSILFKME